MKRVREKKKRGKERKKEREWICEKAGFVIEQRHSPLSTLCLEQTVKRFTCFFYNY